MVKLFTFEIGQFEVAPVVLRRLEGVLLGRSHPNK